MKSQLNLRNRALERLHPLGRILEKDGLLSTETDDEHVFPGWPGNPEEEPGSIIFFGGPILTIIDERPQVEALAIRDGKIIAVGDRKSVFQLHTSRTHMVDLEGRTLMPGFIDPHVHLAWAAFTKYRWMSVSPPMVESRQELIAVLREASRRKRPGEWIIAYGYDPSCLKPGEPQPTALELDQISTSNPIFLAQQSWNTAYVNHKALEIAGITNQTPDCDGSRYVRDCEGNPTGELQGARSFTLFLSAVPQMTCEQNLDDCKRIVRAWARKGCTTVYDTAVGGFWGQEEVTIFLKIASDPETPMRFRAALVPTNDLPNITSIKPGQGNDRLRFVGIKFWADGFAPWAAGVRGIPPVEDPGDGKLNHDEDEFQLQMRGWHKEGWQLLVHANGKRATEQTLRVFEAILTESPMISHRHRIDHCALIDEPQIVRARALGLSVSHLIGQVYWRNSYNDSTASGTCAQCIVPVASEFKHDLIVSLHSDAPATPVEPLRHVQTAVTRMIKDGGKVFGPDQRITVDQALKTVTLYPAYQCFLDDRVGSLEVGKLADLVLLDKNPRTVDPTEIARIKALHTYVASVKQK